MKKQNEKAPSGDRLITSRPKVKVHRETQQSPLQRLLQIQPDLLGIGPEKSLQDVLTAIAETANSLLGGNFCIVFPYDHASDRFLTDQLRAGGIPEAKHFTWGEPRPKGATRTVLEAGELIIEDYADPKYIKKYPVLKERVAGGQRLGPYQDIAPVRASLGVRLQAEKEYFGVLVVNYPESRKFQQSEIDIAKVYASQAAIAIRNARLYGRYRALIDAAETFTALRMAQSPKDTLEKIAKVVHDVLGSDLTVIFPYIQENDAFLMERLVAIGENLEGYTFGKPRSVGGTRKVMAQNDIVRYNLDSAPPEWGELLGSGHFVQHFGIQAVAAVPLKVSQEPVGVLYINYRRHHKFDQAELDLIDAFANQVALILYNTRVLEREQEARSLAETLSDAAANLIQAPTLQDALERSLEQVQKVVPYDGALLLLAEGSKLVSKAAKGFDRTDEVMQFSLQPGEDLIFKEHGNVLKPVILVDAQGDPRWKPVPSVDWVRGWLGIRLYSKTRDVIGEIGLYSRQVGFYNQDHARNLLSFANQAVLAIENARFLDELKIISEIQRKLAEKSVDLDSVINTILESALKLAGANIGQVLLLEEDNVQLAISASTSNIDVGRSDLVIDNCITGRAIQLGRPIRISNLKDDPEHKHLYKPPTGHVANSELTVPLLVGEKAIGALNVESPEFDAFSQHHQDLLVTLAAATAFAIETAKGSVRELKVIEKVQEITLRGSFELKEVFDLIAESARRTTNADTGEVWLLKGEDILENAAIVPDTYAGNAMKNLDVHNSVNGLAVLTRLPQLITDTRETRFYQLASGAEMRSELTVPLLVNKRPIGTINVEALQPNAFTRHQQELLQALAEQAAIAIQSARRQQEQQTITEIQQELLSAAFDEEQVLDLILKRGLKLINATKGQVLLVEGEKLYIRSSTHPSDIGSWVSIQDSVTGIAVEEKRPVRVDDVQVEQPYQSRYKRFLDIDLHSELVVPLIVGNDVLGAINIEDEKVEAFTEEDQSLLEALARQAALTLRLAEAFRIVGTLRNVQDGILSEKYNVEAASAEILRVAQQLIGAETGQILLLENPETLVIKASTNPEEVNKTRVKVSDSVSGIAIERGQAINVADVKAEEPYTSRYKQFLGGNMRSEMVVPLRVGEKITGVVNVESPRVAAFTQRHVEILSTLAGQAAMAFRIAEELEIRKRATEADKMISAGQIVHRLTNRSGAIRNWVELIQKIVKANAPDLENNEGFVFALSDISKKSSEILDLVDELKKRAAEDYAPMDVEQLLLLALQKARESALERKQDLDKITLITNIEPNLPRVKTDPALSEVFWNLLTNSMNVMAEGGRIVVLATSSADRETVYVSFEDTGPGIPKETQHMIFDPNYSSTAGGHGLGLWWSRAFLRAIGGDISLDSDIGKGACFKISLPAAKEQRPQ